MAQATHQADMKRAREELDRGMDLAKWVYDEQVATAERICKAAIDEARIFHYWTCKEVERTYQHNLNLAHQEFKIRTGGYSSGR